MKTIFISLIFLSSAALSQTTVGTDGTIYNRIGDTTITSNGDIINHVGNTAISSNGTIYNTIGNTTIGSDGSISHGTGFGSRSSSSSASRRSSQRTYYPPAGRSYNLPDNYRPSRVYRSSGQYHSSRSSRSYTRQKARVSVKNHTAQFEEGRPCYCLHHNNLCIIARSGDGLALEQIPGSCTANVCGKDLKWSVQRLCKGKWRPLIKFSILAESGDADGDTVKDIADMCPDTPKGAKVWKHGKWHGCSQGQRPQHTKW